HTHNIYGDLADFDSAKLEGVHELFKPYSSTNNAAIAVVGDFDPAVARKWNQQASVDIPSVTVPKNPAITEARQTEEKRFTKEDKLANRPAIAIAYKMPERNTPEYFAMGLIDQLLLQGNDSKLYQKLVQEKGYTGNVGGGINYLGSMFNYNGPMLWMTDLIHDADVSPDSIIAQLDEAIAELHNIDQGQL